MRDPICHRISLFSRISPHSLSQFEIKFESSFIFVSEAVATYVLEFCGVKQFTRFLGVSTDLWESELPWHSILMLLNEKLPAGGRIQGMLQKHAAVLSEEDAHPRSGALFCLSLNMLCCMCEVRFWDGFYKIIKYTNKWGDSWSYFDKVNGRVCQACHATAFASVDEQCKRKETALYICDIKALYNLSTAEIRRQVSPALGISRPDLLSVESARVVALEKYGGDILSLSMALEGRKRAKVARKAELKKVKADCLQQREQQDKV